MTPKNCDPHVGRYIESDSIGLKAGINTYAYAASNSLKRVDPTGLSPPPLAGINTIVCDGHDSIVTQLQTLTGIENKCTGDCLLIHELVHIDQVEWLSKMVPWVLQEEEPK